MSTRDGLDKTVGLDTQQLANAAEEDLFTLISSLINQNAELMQKVEELNSQRGLANSVVPEISKQAETVKLSVEMEAKGKASAIIREAERKARVEADKILLEAKAEADKTRALAKREADDIIEEKTHFAIKQGLLIVNKAQEQALSILDDVRKQAEAINNKTNPKNKR